ncbi:MAG: DNA modification methylase, partial [Chloroflexi bacterium HGW-Chloroflexi-5]
MTNKKLSDLNAADYNPRTISDKALSGLKYSIDEFGDISGFVFNRRTGNLVAAHQRKSALELSDGDYDIQITEEYETPSDKGTVAYGYVDFNGERFNYREVDWELSKEKAANIAANSPTIQGEFTSGVALVLQDINLSDSSLFSALAFNELDIPDIEISIEEDDFDVEKELEAIVEPKTKPGDLYQLGNHRLLCGDATIKSDVGKLLGDKQADMVFTDPPWNVKYGTQKDHPHWKPRIILNDNLNIPEWIEFCEKFTTNIVDVTKKGASIYLVMSAQEWPIVDKALRDAGFHWSSTIIWGKDRLVLSRKDYHTQYEPIWYGWKKGSSRIYPIEDRTQSDLWMLNRPSKSELHPTTKPVELVERAVKNSSTQGDLIIDLFAGSGTTLIACEQLNRITYLIELDPKYCDVIVKRYMKFKEVSKVILNGEEI